MQARHRSLARRLRDREASPVPPVLRSWSEPTAKSTYVANIATALSLLVAILAFAFGTYQYRESSLLQERALKLQSHALTSDTSSKAADVFQRYLEIAHTRPKDSDPEKARAFRVERDNHALQMLNALYTIGKNDDEWLEIIDWKLSRYIALAEKRSVWCLNLTREFRRLIERRVVGPTPMICSDMDYGN